LNDGVNLQWDIMFRIESVCATLCHHVWPTP